MTERKRIKNEGFVGLQLTPDLIKKLDAKAKATTLNRSQIVRMALIEYLKQKQRRVTAFAPQVQRGAKALAQGQNKGYT